MPVFRTQVHEDLWIEANCGTCFERHEAARRLHGKDTQCPILARYHRRKRKPAEWERTRDPLMTKTIKCNEHKARPESIKGNGIKDFEDVPMFDVEPMEDVPLVPVPGWPDKPTKRGTDHA
jgi:hypothetical protein